MLVALSRRCVSGRACHGGGTGRGGHHHRWVGLVLGDGAINGFTVIRAVGDNRGDEAGNLLEQWANLRGVALLAWIIHDECRPRPKPLILLSYAAGADFVEFFVTRSSDWPFPWSWPASGQTGA